MDRVLDVSLFTHSKHVLNDHRYRKAVSEGTPNPESRITVEDDLLAPVELRKLMHEFVNSDDIKTLGAAASEFRGECLRVAELLAHTLENAYASKGLLGDEVCCDVIVNYRRHPNLIVPYDLILIGRNNLIRCRRSDCLRRRGRRGRQSCACGPNCRCYGPSGCQASCRRRSSHTQESSCRQSRYFQN